MTLRGANQRVEPAGATPRLVGETSSAGGSCASRWHERDAAYAQKTTTECVLANAIEAAGRVIQDRERNVGLSERDWEAFFEALLRPPKPTAALRAAFRRHRKLAS